MHDGVCVRYPAILSNLIEHIGSNVFYINFNGLLNLQVMLLVLNLVPGFVTRNFNTME